MVKPNNLGYVLLVLVLLIFMFLAIIMDNGFKLAREVNSNSYTLSGFEEACFETKTVEKYVVIDKLELNDESYEYLSMIMNNSVSFLRQEDSFIHGSFKIKKLFDTPIPLFENFVFKFLPTDTCYSLMSEGISMGEYEYNLSKTFNCVLKEFEVDCDFNRDSPHCATTSLKSINHVKPYLKFYNESVCVKKFLVKSVIE